MRWIHIAQVAFLGIAAWLAYSFAGAAQEGEVRRSCVSLCNLGPNYVGNDRTAPDVDGTAIDGTRVSLSSLRGKVVVMVFWSTTCQTCKQQMPALADLADKIRQDPNYALITVAHDESKDIVEAVMQQAIGRTNAFPVLLDPDSKLIRDRYGTRLYPETWLVDARGVIRARFDGGRDWSSGLVLSALDGLRKGPSCPVEVQGTAASGPAAKFCSQSASN